jgi:fructokinase
VIVVIGEILIDRFPTYQRIGGAPFNFAFHMQQLGFPIRFFSRVGEDGHGRRIIAMLKKKGFDTTDVQIDSQRPTGMVDVELDEHGVPSFDIRENAAYDNLDIDVAMDVADTEMIYFGTLLQRTDNGRRRVQRLLAHHGDDATHFCDINMRPPHVNARAVAESLHHTDLLKLNEAELEAIQRAFSGPTDKHALMPWLMKTFTINAVALTRGSQGSTFYNHDTHINTPAAKGTDIVDTVGAGDAYAAILAAGYVRQIPWAATLGLATRFAARICGIPGAVPDDETFYEDFRSRMKGKADGQ